VARENPSVQATGLALSLAGRPNFRPDLRACSSLSAVLSLTNSRSYSLINIKVVVEVSATPGEAHGHMGMHRVAQALAQMVLADASFLSRRQSDIGRRSAGGSLGSFDVSRPTWRNR
jgi:hypothetical protein